MFGLYHIFQGFVRYFYTAVSSCVLVATHEIGGRTWSSLRLLLEELAYLIL